MTLKEMWGNITHLLPSTNSVNLLISQKRIIFRLTFVEWIFIGRGKRGGGGGEGEGEIENVPVDIYLVVQDFTAGTGSRVENFQRAYLCISYDNDELNTS